MTLKPDFYYLRWFASGNQPSNLITFELTVRTKGWAGLGFSRTGGMGGADIVVYQSSNGKLLV